MENELLDGAFFASTIHTANCKACDATAMTEENY